MSDLLAVSFGGGSDSTAMLIEFRNRDVRPSRIQFADTGRRDAEKQATYDHVDRLGTLCQRWFGIPIVWVRNDGMYGALYDNCITKKMLPSLAYGFKSCSDKYKHRPMEKDIARWEPAIRLWASGGKVTKAIGYNANEPHRALAITEDARYRYWHPLVEWGITRSAVREVCQSELGYVPAKSACFFCPASKKSEILWLKQNEPLKYERAIVMERNAQLTSVKGLGRAWSWEELVRADEAQFKMFPETVETPCMCLDGGDDEDE